MQNESTVVVNRLIGLLNAGVGRAGVLDPEGGDMPGAGRFPLFVDNQAGDFAAALGLNRWQIEFLSISGNRCERVGSGGGQAEFTGAFQRDADRPGMLQNGLEPAFVVGEGEARLSRRRSRKSHQGPQKRPARLAVVNLPSHDDSSFQAERDLGRFPGLHHRPFMVSERERPFRRINADSPPSFDDRGDLESTLVIGLHGKIASLAIGQ